MFLFTSKVTSTLFMPGFSDAHIEINLSEYCLSTLSRINDVSAENTIALLLIFLSFSG